MLTVLLGGFVLSAALASYGQAPTPTEPRGNPKQQTAQEQKKASNDKRGTDESPLIIKVLPPTNSEKNPEEVTKEQKDHSTEYGWISDFLLAIFTGGLFVATWLLWRATEKLVRGSEKTSQRQLRAYIAVDGDKIPLRNLHPDELEIHMVMKNCGQTPAFKLTHWVSAAIGPDPIQSELGRQNPLAPEGIYVPPGMIVDFITTIKTPWTVALFEMDIGDNTCLHVWGEINYVDIFEESHIVKFRFIKRRGEGRSNLEYYQNGNDAD